jgi:hypothetical protein
MNFRAVARPMPLLPPVMTATFPRGFDAIVNPLRSNEQLFQREAGPHSQLDDVESGPGGDGRRVAIRNGLLCPAS